MVNVLSEILNKDFDVLYDEKRKGQTCGYTTKFEGGYTHYYICVKFYDTGEKMDFYFPDQFKIHLKAVNKEIQKMIVDLINPTITFPPTDPPPLRRLMFGGIHGKNSKEIYECLCKLFNWDISKKGYFGMRTLMYATNCTPEDYSVWFIPHNNLFEAFNENFNWFNFKEGNIIKEIWLGQENWSLRNDWSDRVTFIKTKEGYCFYGIYRPQEIIEKEINHKIRKVKIYKQISKEYSNQ